MLIFAGELCLSGVQINVYSPDAAVRWNPAMIQKRSDDGDNQLRVLNSQVTTKPLERSFKIACG